MTRYLLNRFIVSAVLIGAAGIVSMPAAFSAADEAPHQQTVQTSETHKEVLDPSLEKPVSSFSANSLTPAGADYVIQPDDVMQINVYEEPELTTAVRVSAQGDINFPLLGTVRAANLTVAQFQQELTRLLGEDYLINPQVQVFIQAYHNRTVSVTGAVSKPGSYQMPIGKPLTMLEAVAMAGGFTKAAAINKVKIIRLVNGQAQTLEVNAKEIIKKGDKSKDVEIKSNDVIFVPESWI